MMTHVNTKAMPTEDINYNCHINKLIYSNI